NEGGLPRSQGMAIFPLSKGGFYILIAALVPGPGIFRKGQDTAYIQFKMRGIVVPKGQEQAVRSAFYGVDRERSNIIHITIVLRHQYPSGLSGRSPHHLHTVIRKPLHG